MGGGQNIQSLSDSIAPESLCGIQEGAKDLTNQVCNGTAMQEG